VHTPTAIEIDTLKTYAVTAADHLHKLLGDETIEAKAPSLSSRFAPAVAREAEGDWGR
jgi:hypothetical protein